jgi:hypothetical protein
MESIFSSTVNAQEAGISIDAKIIEELRPNELK